MSTEPVVQLSAQQRLAASRRALLLDLQGDLPDSPAAYPDAPAVAAGAAPRRAAAREGFVASLLSKSPWGLVAKRVAARWWARHPANAATHLAAPVLQRYARQEPVKLIAAAAGVGVLIVLVKPWRLLSLTAILAAVLKTSDIAAMVTSLMEIKQGARKDRA
ncbi:MAG: hypothetical protein EOO22_00435 [Comamonadaceae bacterium]|nr:MAG: hypothetical protein EOO22_00435 [Comamonadaceae bacterium]